MNKMAVLLAGHLFSHQVENGGIEWSQKLDADDPILLPPDLALNRFKTGERDENTIALVHIDWDFDPAARWRKIEDIDLVAMVTRAADINVGA